MGLRRRGGWIALALGVLAAAWFLFGRSDAGPVWRTVEVDRGDITTVIAASGKLQALDTVEVGSQVSGQIIELNADFNTQVKEGQVLARIDPAIIGQAFWFIAEIEGLLAGTVALVPREGYMELTGLTTEPFFRGRGVGHALAEYAVSTRKDLDGLAAALERDIHDRPLLSRHALLNTHFWLDGRTWPVEMLTLSEVEQLEATDGPYLAYPER